MSTVLDTYRHTDQVIPYIALTMGMDLEDFYIKLSAYVREHKREAVPSEYVSGTYLDLLKSLGYDTVRQYEARVRSGVINVLELIPIAYFLNVRISIYSVDASGTKVALQRVFNENAENETEFDIAVVGGHLSLYLDGDGHPSGPKQVQRRLQLNTVKALREQASASRDAAHIRKIVQLYELEKAKKRVARHLDELANGNGSLILTTAQVHELANAYTASNGKPEFTPVEIANALIERDAAEKAGEKNILTREQLLRSIQKSL